MKNDTKGNREVEIIYSVVSPRSLTRRSSNPNSANRFLGTDMQGNSLLYDEKLKMPNMDKVAQW